MNKDHNEKDAVDQYNIVADTVTGVNIHARDNIIQLISCSAGLLLGAFIGLLFGGGVGARLLVLLLGL